MRVADVMTQASVTDSPADTLRSAAERMWRQQTGSLVVMDGDQMVGIITERDLLKAIAQGVDVETATVGDMMTRDVVTAYPDEPLRDAARMMAAHWIRHLPVTADGAVVGMLSMRDVTGVFAALSKDPDAVELEVDQLVREKRLARIEAGDLD
jgi:signal-transduction protein with cAMP-binding, CBS, and nucleotidyltransferase domain